MFRPIALGTLALVWVSPTLAQDSMPAPSPSTSASPQTSAQPDTMPMPSPAPDAAPVPEAALAAEPPRDAAAAKSAAIQDVVNTEFSVYDANKNAKLNKVEFTKWATALRSKSDVKLGKTKALPPAEMIKWANAAFVEADQDKNKAVTKDEMLSFLMG